jgi:hypothetical protein
VSFTIRADKMEYSEISSIILDELKKINPNNVDELVEKIYEKYSIPKKQIIDVLTSLVDSKEIDLRFPLQRNQIFSQFIFSIDAIWFWLEVILSLIAVVSIYFINDSASSLMYIRNIMGFVFSLFLPGYGFIKAILPYREFSLLERMVLSIGSSIAIVPFIGLFLNYINNLTVAPIIFIIFILTIIFSIIGIWREYKKATSK